MSTTWASRRAGRLPPAQSELLRAVAAGWTLKAHRDLEGRKSFVLHPPAGEPRLVAPGAVAALVEAGLLDSNKKFPAATFWLTPQGQEAVGSSKQ